MQLSMWKMLDVSSEMKWNEFWSDYIKFALWQNIGKLWVIHCQHGNVQKTKKEREKKMKKINRIQGRKAIIKDVDVAK